MAPVTRKGRIKQPKLYGLIFQVLNKDESEIVADVKKTDGSKCLWRRA